jgi:UDP-GlcNAc:undecaprenyl-phosphate GlcNAc-1-phosphate transferase
MGDCGSLFLGFFLAGSALLYPSAGRSRSFLPVLAVPVLMLFIPIFDTLFVMLLRRLVGRPVSQGGRDHTSHRLVALGLSERKAVLLLYGLAALSGLLAVSVTDLPLDVSLAAIAGFTIVLTLLGFQLARVKVYDEEELRRAKETPLVAFLVNLSYKRRVTEICLDVALIALSYYTAHALVHGPVAQIGSWERFLPVLAAVVGVKLSSFLALGVYRGLWRYVSLDSLMVYGKAVFAGTVACVLVLTAVGRADALSRAVVALDGLLLLVLLSGTRLSFRLLRRLVPPPAPVPGRRVLIYGSGDAGVLLARELFENPARGLVPVGFADDDPFKIGSVIHGLKVYEGNGSLIDVCRDRAVDEVLISSAELAPERLDAIARACFEARIALRRMSILLERLHEPSVPG